MIPHCVRGSGSAIGHGHRSLPVYDEHIDISPKPRGQAIYKFVERHYCASMGSQYSIAGHWAGGFDEAGLRRWAEELRGRLSAPRVSLGLVFMSPRFFAQAAEVLEILRVHAQVPLLAGCSSQGLIVGGQEVEENAGLSLGLYAFPEADLRAYYFN